MIPPRLGPIDRLRRVRAWQGDLPVQSRYTVGVAAQPFFQALKEEGRLLASWCPDCQARWLPPTLACPECFGTLEEHREVELPGTVEAVTSVHLDLFDQPLSQPQQVALIRFEGVRGGILHHLLDSEPVGPGDRVKPVLRPPEERTGTITDIRGFRRV